MPIRLLTRLRRRTPEQPFSLDWAEIRATDTSAHPGFLLDMLDKKHDGMTISGVFTRAEIDRALPVFEAHRADFTPEPFGSMLGMPLGQGGMSRDRTAQIEDGLRARAIYRKAFGFDPHDRLVEVLTPMAGDLHLSYPTEGGRPYNAGNVRYYEPGMGGLRAHVGNEFLDISGSGSMSHLAETTRVRNHLSYFVVLQPPLEGGELSVYDLDYGTHPVHETPWDSALRDDRAFDRMRCRRFSPGPGDLIVFGGGWRWHRIEPVHGTRTRVTYGGFAAPDAAGQVLHLWC
jgi:hypothetical protein